MRRAFRGDRPDVAGDAFVAETTYLVGDVSVAPGASVWPFVCLRGDGGPVSVGADANVQEFSMLHAADIGARTTVGHHATVDYATVGEDALVGIGSAVLSGATVGEDCLVAAGSVVPEDDEIPPGHLAYGAPVETRPLTDEQREEVRRIAEHYVDLGAEYAAAGLGEDSTD